MKYLGLVSFSFSFCASELVEAEGKVFGLKKRKKKKKKGFQPHSFLQVGFTTVVDGGFVLTGASCRGSVLLLKPECAAVHSEQWRLGPHQVGAGSS